MIYVIGESLGSGSGYTTSHRMADLIGVEREAFMREIVWINLYDQPGCDPRKYVAMIDRASTPDDAIILLGRRVAKDYGVEHFPPLTVVRRHGGMGSTVVAFPHPSGINRWWNRRANVQMATVTLKQIWREHL